MKKCKCCNHEMTEAGKDSIAHARGECFGCLPITHFVGQRVFGGSDCTQADHDLEAVEVGRMTEAVFFERNPKAVGLVRFEVTS